MIHLSMPELESGLENVYRSPKDCGSLEMIVRRPSSGEREILQEAELDIEIGLSGDNWSFRQSSRTPDKPPDPDKQLAIMNSRVIALLAQTKDRWPLAGDQLYIDLDLSETNCPAGTRISIGSAVIEITRQLHTGCHKFIEHFGLDAAKLVNSSLGKRLHLRGVNAKVIRSGIIHTGDTANKVL